MPDNPRIEELRRRVQTDPASIAFAQLAEEYRRAGSYEDAIAICRAGLDDRSRLSVCARHAWPRAHRDERPRGAAEAELTYVLRTPRKSCRHPRPGRDSPSSRGTDPRPSVFYQCALALARHDPDLEQAVDDISRALRPTAAAERRHVVRAVISRVSIGAG